MKEKGLERTSTSWFGAVGSALGGAVTEWATNIKDKTMSVIQGEVMDDSNK